MQRPYRLLARCLLAALVISFALVALGLADECALELRAIGGPRVIEETGYVYEPNPLTGSAVWVAEYLPDNHFPALDVERPKFHADANLPATLRVRPEVYADSDYDRGHLRAAANARTLEEFLATFNMSNAVPQNRSCNRGPGARLEAHVRTLAPCYVITAPVYQRRPPRFVGPLPVPTHLCKIVYEPIRGRMLAWRLANDARGELLEITADAVEADVQRDFFARLPDDDETRLEAGN